MKYLYLPLEFTVRELDGYCLLASQAVARGISVVIAPRYALYDYLDTLPTGIFLLKGIRPAEIREIAMVKSGGNQIAYLDQEGLLQYDYHYLTGQKFDDTTIRGCDYIFALSAKHYDLLAKHVPSELRSRVRLTGNPRFDFCQRYARDYYREEVEPYILFTTSFGNVNPHHGRGSQEFLNMITGLTKGQASLDREIERAQLNQQMLLRYVQLFEDLARRAGDRRIVVRPHLSENIQFWRDVAAPFPNVTVEPADSIYKWLANAAVHVHFNSTTCVEAVMMGVPSVTLNIPPEYERFKLEECFALSFVYDDSDQLVDAVVRGDLVEPRPLEGLLPDIATRDSSNTLLDALEFPEVTGRFAPRQKLRTALGRTYRLWKHKLFTWNFSSSYHNRKIGTLSEAMLRERFEYFARAQRMPAYRLRTFGRHCFIVEPSR
jgi:surface carbohydrate biosynthesis protein